MAGAEDGGWEPRLRSAGERASLLVWNAPEGIVKRLTVHKAMSLTHAADLLRVAMDAATRRDLDEAAVALRVVVFEPGMGEPLVGWGELGAPPRFAPVPVSHLIRAARHFLADD